MNIICRKTAIILVACLLAVGISQQADAQEQDGKRFSIKLQSGLSYASDRSDTFGWLEGRFTVPSHSRQVYGGAVQYAINPTWSFETSVLVGEFENRFIDDPFYENKFANLSVKGIANLDDLLNIQGGITRVFNPYLSLGFGMMGNDLETDDLVSKSLSTMFTGGAGLSIYVTRFADLFAQYDYHVVGSKLLDGVTGSGNSDHFAALSGGIRINFGRKNTKLPSWPAPRMNNRSVSPQTEQPAEEMEEPEPEEAVADTVVEEETEPEVTDTVRTEDLAQDEPVEEEEEVEETTEVEDQVEREELARRRAGLASREPQWIERPNAGPYIQVLSSENRMEAERLWEQAVSGLEGVVKDPIERVFISPYRDEYKILTGPFNDSEHARLLLIYVREVYDDAFVISYPRP